MNFHIICKVYFKGVVDMTGAAWTFMLIVWVIIAGVALIALRKIVSKNG